MFAFKEAIGMNKYIGRVVEIIYLDRSGKITQRKIEVRAIQGRVVRAYCLQQRAPRVFVIDRILAIAPVYFKAAVYL
jgi:predicted DNA-binding transcriptional regulator YafY